MSDCECLPRILRILFVVNSICYTENSSSFCDSLRDFVADFLIVCAQSPLFGKTMKSNALNYKEYLSAKTLGKINTLS